MIKIRDKTGKIVYRGDYVMEFEMDKVTTLCDETTKYEPLKGDYVLCLKDDFLVQTNR